MNNDKNENNKNKSWLGYILLILDLFLICCALFVAYGRNPIVYASEFNDIQANYNPSPVSSNPILFKYTGNDYNISIMNLINRNVTDNDKPILNNNSLSYTELLTTESVNMVSNVRDTLGSNLYMRQVYNTHVFNNNSLNYYGVYFNSKFLYYEEDDIDKQTNTSIFNHLRITLYANSELFMAYSTDNDNLIRGFNINDFTLNLFVFLNNPMLYTSSVYSTPQHSAYITFTYPNDSVSLSMDNIIKTSIPLYQLSGNNDDYIKFNQSLIDGVTIDFYFKNWLGFSNFNNFIGLVSNTYIDETYDADPYIYMSSYLDYVPITFNWDDNQYQTGFNDGVNSVNTDLYFEDGYKQGVAYARDNVYQDAYNSGYQAGLTESSQDYGFFDLLFTIVNAPVNVLMQALSFSVFGVNVWSMILTLLTLCIVIWLVRKIFGGN